MCTAIKLYLNREERFEQEKREDLERWDRYRETGEVVLHDDASLWLLGLAQGQPSPCPR